MLWIGGVSVQIPSVPILLLGQNASDRMDKTVIEVSRSFAAAAPRERSERSLLNTIKTAHPNCDLRVIRRAALYAVTDSNYKEEEARQLIYSLARNLGISIRMGEY